MFQYNPTVNDISGQIYGQGLERVAGYNADAIRAQAESDAIRSRRQFENISELAGSAANAAKTVAAFMIGGPAGAAMASGGGGGGGGAGGGDGMIGSIISSFANKKALDAKDQAYTSFFSKHGKDLGFDPSYLDELKAMSRDDRLTSYELMTGAPGQRLGSLNYMNQQASLFGGGRGTGAGGGGGGGQAGGYTVGQGWR